MLTNSPLPRRPKRPRRPAPRPPSPNGAWPGRPAPRQRACGRRCLALAVRAWPRAAPARQARCQPQGPAPGARGRRGRPTARRTRRAAEPRRLASPLASRPALYPTWRAWHTLTWFPTWLTAWLAAWLPAPAARSRTRVAATSRRRRRIYSSSRRRRRRRRAYSWSASSTVAARAEPR